jgi:glycosyltransferase involved in cell wall biosynthesis
MRAQSELDLGLGNVESTHVDRFQMMETALALAADATIVVTDAEGEMLRSLVPELRTFTIPTIHRSTGGVKSVQNRNGMMFVGNFWHAPNCDAVLWFVDEILPLILQRRPQEILRVVGANMPPNIQMLNRPGLEIVGYVEDITPFYDQTRVSIAPLRFGAGMKGKVGESAAFGVPVVGTALAFDGFSFKSGQECKIADDPETFSKAVVEMLTDNQLWRAISQSAMNATSARCDPANVAEILREMLVSLDIPIPFADERHLLKPPISEGTDGFQ